MIWRSLYKITLTFFIVLIILEVSLRGVNLIIAQPKLWLPQVQSQFGSVFKFENLTVKGKKYPSFSVQNIAIEYKNHKLTAEKLNFKLSLWKSLYFQKIHFKQIELENASIVVSRSQEEKSETFSGIPFLFNEITLKKVRISLYEHQNMIELDLCHGKYPKQIYCGGKLLGEDFHLNHFEHQNAHSWSIPSSSPERTYLNLSTINNKQLINYGFPPFFQDNAEFGFQGFIDWQKQQNFIQGNILIKQDNTLKHIYFSPRGQTIDPKKASIQTEFDFDHSWAEINALALSYLSSSLDTPWARLLKEKLINHSPKLVISALLQHQDLSHLTMEWANANWFFDAKNSIQNSAGLLRCDKKFNCRLKPLPEKILLTSGAFKDPKEFSYIGGPLRIETSLNDGLTLSSDSLILEHDNTMVSGAIELHIPFSTPEKTIINLDALVHNTDAKGAITFLPDNVWSDHLFGWLRKSIHQISIQNAQVKWHGLLLETPRNDHERQFHISAPFKNLSLQYAPQFSIFKAETGLMHFTEQGFSITIPVAQHGEVSITNIQAEMGHHYDSTLKINAEIHDTSEDVLAFLKSNHLIEDVPFKASGAVQSNLELHLPLQALNKATFRAENHVQDNHITLSHEFLSFHQVSGDFILTQNDIKQAKLDAKWLEQPIQVELSGSKQNNRFYLDTATSGIFDPSVIAKLQLLPNTVVNQLNGQCSVQVNYQITYHPEHQTTSHRFWLFSDFLGVESTLPFPFSKDASERQASILSWEFNPSTNTSLGQININHRLEGLFTQPLNPNNPSEFTIKINDPINYEDISKINDLFPTTTTGRAFRAYFSAPKLTVGTFEFTQPEARYNNTTIPTETSLHFKSQEAEGHWSQKHGKQQLAINRLNLNLSSKSDGVPLQLPKINLDLKTNDVVLNQYHFDELNGTLSSQDNHLKIEKIKAKERSLNITGDIDIDVLKQKINSNLSLKADNSEDALAWLQYEPFLKGGKLEISGHSEISLHPKTELRHGAFTFKLENGEFHDVNVGVVSKLLGFLTLQGVINKLKLNFSDLLTEGMAFNQITGSVEAKDNKLITCDTLVDALSMNIALEGALDLAKETIEQHATVFIKLGDALPSIIAVINPFAGAATWFGKEVLSKPLQDLTSKHYLITGTLQDPISVEKNAETHFKDCKGRKIPLIQKPTTEHLKDIDSTR